MGRPRMPRFIPAPEPGEDALAIVHMVRESVGRSTPESVAAHVQARLLAREAEAYERAKADAVRECEAQRAVHVRNANATASSELAPVRWHLAKAETADACAARIRALKGTP